MSYVFRTYACDGGGQLEEHTFELMQDRTEGPPAYCPKCGRKVSSTPRPARIAIGGAVITKAVDSTYRALEAQGQAAFERTNNPNMKITNMNDHLREGDVAAKMPDNSISRFMRQADGKGVTYGWGGGGSMIAPATTTPLPIDYRGYTGAGHAALSAIQGNQGRTAQEARLAATVKGQINKGPPR